MPETEPTRLVTSLTQAVLGALHTASDKWIRLELPKDWPVADALKNVFDQVAELRLGVLRPFTVTEADIGCLVSDTPSEITSWRNQTVESRRTSPTIIIGDARKDEESGLRALPHIINDEDVLRRWQTDLFEWLRKNITSDTPLQFFKSLFDLARSGLVDAVRLDEYATSALKHPDNALAALRTELWRINLLPDDRALDADSARSRLELNIEARQLLLSASDTPTDINRLKRLRDVAAGNDDATVGGNAGARTTLAQRVLQYREGRDRTLLRSVRLDDLLTVLTPKRPRTKPQKPKDTKLSRKIDLFELFDEAGKADPGVARETLEELGEKWDLESFDSVELVAGFNQSAETPMDVRVKVTPAAAESPLWAGDGTSSSQMLAFMAGIDAQRDWIPRLPEGIAINGDNLLEAARTQDILLRRSKYEGLTNDYITARAGLAKYERWLRGSAFTLLLLNNNAREAIRNFLLAWHALVDEVNREPAGGAEAIRGALILLEAMWGKDPAADNYEWCVLGPFHPYTLDPLLRLADYVLSSMGQDQLGKKVTWALDRATPSYRVLWARDAVLYLARQNQVFEFQRSPVSVYPPADSGDGITQVARAFLGYHPFAKETLVITLVNPPKGSAVVKNLRRLQQEVRELRVYLVTTHADTSQLEGSSEIVRNLGRFASVEEWCERNPVRSHLLFNFTERAADSASSSGGVQGPTPGAHVALRILLEISSPFDTPPRLSPFVTFAPRDSNSPVVDIQRLSTANLGAPRLFKTQPMLSEEVTRRFVQVSELADWAVIGVPSPLGLIAPRKLGTGLAYLGREALGPYGLYVYATSLFSVGKLVAQGLAPSPVTTDHTRVEEQLTKLAVQSANSVLQIGRNPDGALREQLGVIVSSSVTRRVEE